MRGRSRMTIDGGGGGDNGKVGVGNRIGGTFFVFSIAEKNTFLGVS